MLGLVDLSVDSHNKYMWQMMELVELTALRDLLVGVPGGTGLSIEQRKRLSIAVELIPNPSVVLMDEPTTGSPTPHQGCPRNKFSFGFCPKVDIPGCRIHTVFVRGLVTHQMPSAGLDSRAAAIVMRVVRNIVDTGRTITCTVHQPSIEIFEVRSTVHAVRARAP